MKLPSPSKWIENWPAKTLALVVALLLFLMNRFESLETRVYTVPLRLVTDTALVPAQEYDAHVKVTVRGAKEVMGLVTDSDLEATVDFSDHQGEGVFSAPILVTRKGNAAETQALEVSVQPMVLSLHLEAKESRQVAVRPNFVGQPGKSFELSGFQVDPAQISVEGPRTVVDKLSSLNTEPIELRGKTENFRLRSRVVGDSTLLSFPFGDTVEVRGLMTSTLANLVLDNVTPSILSLNPLYQLKTPLPKVRVRLRGADQALQKLPRDLNGAPTVALFADLSTISGPGTPTDVELKAVLPDGVELVELSPAVVSVELEVKP